MNMFGLFAEFHEPPEKRHAAVLRAGEFPHLGQSYRFAKLKTIRGVFEQRPHGEKPKLLHGISAEEMGAAVDGV